MTRKIILYVLAWNFLFSGPGFSQIPVIGPVLKNTLDTTHDADDSFQYLDETVWNSIFPHRYGTYRKDSNSGNSDFYSFRAFVSAARLFPGFLSNEEEDVQKRELCAFLASIAYETGRSSTEAPEEQFKWGLYYLKEKTGNGFKFLYADTADRHYPAIFGTYYYGRGPMQLSWNYNYGKFSEAWFGDKYVLLQNPDLLFKDSVLSFASAIWFWMTPQFPKPSCHDIMVSRWKPSKDDISKGRLPGFGAVVNIINGGISCGNSNPKTAYRYLYYQFFCNYFHVSPGGNIDCSFQRPFGE
jgi:basic endochitinase B